jgi:2-keto-4-pentenoate hydratase/2-oxohepta-3-ene-1,7-dioic acid hydratase in catechol pathway
MRFVTFARDQNPRLGLRAGDHVIDLNSADSALPPTMRGFLDMGALALKHAAGVLKRWDEGQLAPEMVCLQAGLPLLAPILNPSKIVAVGANYWDHCREGNDPSLATRVDYEAELAIVIGERARRVPRARAYDVIFGYTCANDVSARDLQFGDGQWVRGKSLDSFCPLGPELVTKDDVPEPGNLAISCRVNGKTLQDSSTAEMIFDVPTLIEFITAAFTLLPGDVILTGTPHGTGAIREPNILLKDGDRVGVGVEKLGVLRNPCREMSVEAVPSEA